MSVESRISYSDNPLMRTRADHIMVGSREVLETPECYKSPPRILAFMGASGSGKDVALEILTSLPGRRGVSKKLELTEPVSIRIVPKFTDRAPRYDETSKIPITAEEFVGMRESGKFFAEYTLKSNGCHYAYRMEDFNPTCHEEFLATEPSILHIMELKEKFGDLIHCTFLASSRKYREQLLIKRATESEEEIKHRLDEGDGQTYIALLLAGKPVEFINQFISPEISGYFQKLANTNPKDWHTSVYKRELANKIGEDLVDIFEKSLSNKGNIVDELINIDRFKTFIDDIVILEDKFITDNPYEAGLFSESVIDSATRMLLNSENRVHSSDQTADSFVICNLIVPESARDVESVFGIPYAAIQEAVRTNQKDRSLLLDGVPKDYYGNIRWVSYYEDRNHVFGLIIRDPNNPDSIMSFRATRAEGADNAEIEFQIQLAPVKRSGDRYIMQMAFMSKALKLCEMLGVKKFHFTEHFDLVDEQDTVIGIIPRIVAHETGTSIHRASSVLLWRLREDPDTKKKVKQLFMVRRSKNKKMNAHLWQGASSGHLLPGETYSEAARRELREEIGSKFARKIQTIKPLAHIHVYSDESTSANPQKENFSFFTAFLDEDTSNQVATNYESDAAMWLDIDVIKDMISAHPEDFRDAFRQVFSSVDWNSLTNGKDN